MFRSARIKLTLAYLIIMTAVTSIFSGIVYVNVDRFTQRALLLHERRVETRLRDFSDIPIMPERFQTPFTEEAIEQVRQNTIVLLVTVNVIILALSGSFGYWFAGVTLKPIEEMTKKQKKFVADAAHELKTPLTAIKTQLEVNLRDKKLNVSGVRKLLRSTIEDVDSLTMLTNTLLAQSKFQDYEPEKEFEVFDLKTLVKKTTARFKEELKTKNITLSTNIPSLNIKASKSGLNELITILLDNAIKFNVEGGKIDISAEKTSDHVELRIADTGVGIEEKDLPRLFERFYKADLSRTKVDHDGFGLGLSIAKDITEAHKGTISVKSEKDKGTTFIVKLPLSI